MLGTRVGMQLATHKLLNLPFFPLSMSINGICFDHLLTFATKGIAPISKVQMFHGEKNPLYLSEDDCATHLMQK